MKIFFGGEIGEHLVNFMNETGPIALKSDFHSDIPSARCEQELKILVRVGDVSKPQ